MLKLPKDVAADPRHDAVVAALAANAQVLWERGQVRVATVPFTTAMQQQLRYGLASRKVQQGLESIGDALDREQKGLDALAKKASSGPQNPRISRVLLIANDGSPRFLRDCDALLTRYAHRVVGCRLDVTGEALGAAVVGAPKVVRAILVMDKTVAAKVLLAMLPPG